MSAFGLVFAAYYLCASAVHSVKEAISDSKVQKQAINNGKTWYIDYNGRQCSTRTGRPMYDELDMKTDEVVEYDGRTGREINRYRNPISVQREREFEYECQHPKEGQTTIAQYSYMDMSGYRPKRKEYTPTRYVDIKTREAYEEDELYLKYNGEYEERSEDIKKLMQYFHCADYPRFYIKYKGKEIIRRSDYQVECDKKNYGYKWYDDKFIYMLNHPEEYNLQVRIDSIRRI